MCGIAGRLDAREPLDPAPFARMVDALAHRGPDARGLLEPAPGCQLGHRRLAVLDLSPEAGQPFVDPSGRHALVFNGEIYNHGALRARLERRGRRFRTRSDTEVLLHALLEWGIDALPQLNGMFAFALHDARAGTLLLARDRFGKKPLYYRLSPGRLSFASELSPLADDPLHGPPAPLSLEGLNQFLAAGYILHPRTIRAGIFKLPPASYAIWRGGRLEAPRRWWDYAALFRERFPGTRDEAVEELDARLAEAVRLRLKSDVPLGVFLSGGLDSSAVARYAASAAGGRVKTFCLGFADPAYDESADAERVARFLGTDHHRFRFDPVADEPVAALNGWDEPFSDTSLLPFRALCRRTREHVTVALSGDGADELFAGYPTYAASMIAHRLRAVPVAARRTLGALLRLLPEREGGKIPWSMKARRFGAGVGEPPASAHARWRELHDEAARRRLLGPGHAALARGSDPARRVEELFARVADLPPLHRCLFVDGLTWLTDDILVKADRASMAFGLEIRCPFLDPAVAALAASLPPEWKWRAGRGKVILKELLRRHLPRETLGKRKAGFNAPVRELVGGGGGDEFIFFNRFVYDNHRETAWRAAGRRPDA